MKHKSFHSIHHSNQLVLKDLKLLIMPMFVFCFLNRPSFAHALHVILNRGVWSTWQIQTDTDITFTFACMTEVLLIYEIHDIFLGSPY